MYNNQADAFKHTFGSALMVFEFGNFGSLAGGIFHEEEQKNNPQGEWNMDSWNNHQGRVIAEEIIKEYGEKKFRSLPQEEQEDIIAQKVMVKMKNGDLITRPDDTRVYKGGIENFSKGAKKFYEYMKRPVEIGNGKIKVLSNKSVDNTGFENILINGKKWADLDKESRKSFIEGFDNNAFTDEGIKRAKLQEKVWTDKFNIGNPAIDDGRWVTMPNGKHLFIKN